MKCLILILCLIVNSIGNVPEDFTITNTWENNGVLSFVDEYGNGVDIYKLPSNVDIETGKVFIERKTVIDAIDPVDTIVTLKGEVFILEAYFLKLGDPFTHEEFERKAIQFLRNLAQGGRHGKASSVCGGFVCWPFDGRSECQSRPLDVFTI